jgi:hypothetical protein
VDRRRRCAENVAAVSRAWEVGMAEVSGLMLALVSCQTRSLHLCLVLIGGCAWRTVSAGVAVAVQSESALACAGCRMLCEVGSGMVQIGGAL